MRRTQLSVLIWATGAALGIALGAGRAEEQPPLAELAQSRVRDLSVTMVMVKQDERELGRMGKDFRDAYRFSRAMLRFLEPGRMRLDSRVGFLSVRYVVNQNRKLLAIPGIGIRSVKDISDCPGCRQGLMEVGLLSLSLLEMMDVEPLGAGAASGGATWRYAYRYRKERFPKRQEIVVDTLTRTLVERSLFNADGTLKARFLYKDPLQVAPGVWVPQRVEVHSPRGKCAATMRYENIHVNTGLKEEAFAF